MTFLSLKKYFFPLKVIPIEETCYASMPQILSSLSGMLSKHLESFTKEFDFPPCYAIDFKARNTQAIERQPVYDEVVALMNEQSKGSKVNLTMPDLLIVVHVSFGKFLKKIFWALD